MSYKERLKSIIGNDDEYLFEKIDKFIEANFTDNELGIIQIENLTEDKDAFDEFVKMLRHTKDENLKEIINEIKGLNLFFKYSQKELKEFFYHQMTNEEQKKIDSLNLENIISKMETSTYKIKYIDNVGYTLIGEGYLILLDGKEPTHYFAKIFADADTAKKEIMHTFNERK